MSSDEEHKTALEKANVSILNQLSHEINNPLQTIQFLADNILRAVKRGDAPKLESIEKYAASILKSVEHAGKVVRGMQLAQRQLSTSEDREWMSLEPLLSDALGLACGKSERQNIQITIETSPQDARVFCNTTQIKQVILNLLSNACDALANTEKPFIKVEGRLSADRVDFWVWDNGPGIPTVIGEKMFHRVTSSKPSDKGLGIGLILSKQLVDLHGGGIEVCASDSGTCFHFYIPQ